MTRPVHSKTHLGAGATAEAFDPTRLATAIEWPANITTNRGNGTSPAPPSRYQVGALRQLLPAPLPLKIKFPLNHHRKP